MAIEGKQEDLTLNLIYSRDCYQSAGAEQFLANYKKVLELIAAGVDFKLEELAQLLESKIICK